MNNKRIIFLVIIVIFLNNCSSQKKELSEAEKKKTNQELNESMFREDAIILSLKYNVKENNVFDLLVNLYGFKINDNIKEIKNFKKRIIHYSRQFNNEVQHLGKQKGKCYPKWLWKNTSN